MTIAEEVVEKLNRLGLSVATAESCTGGMIGSLIVDVSGASCCYNEGYITYSNEAKHKNLGVNENTLDKFGAVSPETAEEMAKGVMKRADVTFGVASTGIAGPTGGTDLKPVGLIYIACAYLDRVKIVELRLGGNRTENRETTAKKALELLNECISLYEEEK